MSACETKCCSFSKTRETWELRKKTISKELKLQLIWIVSNNVENRSYKTKKWSFNSIKIVVLKYLFETDLKQETSFSEIFLTEEAAYH